jgi:3-methylfumaryl-CoA hydratase
MDEGQLKSWIGRRETATNVLTSQLVQEFAATLDLEGDWTVGADIPQMVHWCLTQHMMTPTKGLGPDGHTSRGGFMPPVPLPRRMWGGGALSFFGGLRVGDRVTRASEISDVTLKEGRSGPLCFVSVSHQYSTDNGPVLQERSDIVYREAGKTAVRTADRARPGTYTCQVDPTPALLFRYSAATFNGHRIHYDLPYARDEEGYPGLVVHGPLQATLLCHFAAELKGSAPRQFSFRSLSPVFDTSSFTINAEPDGNSLHLWTAQSDGPVAMQANATW